MPYDSPSTYARPKGATPLKLYFVIAYKPCTSPNRQHGGPLAVNSCNPPQQESGRLTVGTLDANGQAANSVGSVRLDVKQGDTSTPANEADVMVDVSITDVRKQSDLSDYTGELQVNPVARITDRLNGPSQTEPATTQDTAFPMTVACAATPSTTVGGT